MFLRGAFFLLLTALLVGCTDDLSQTNGLTGFMSDDEFFPTVTPELRPFFIAFEEEAANRGLTFDLTELGVTGNIVELGNNSVLGVCRHNENEPNRIAVDIDAWVDGSESLRELIVFHELGHCVLDRLHRDESENGQCLSIMHSGLTDCITPLSDPRFREQYLDELFFF